MVELKTNYDAVVVGSGPNGMACAIKLVQAGRRVVLLERAETPGGGVRTAEITKPGFHHDICSAVYPLAIASPFFKSLPLEAHGLKWLYGEAELAHPFDDGTAALLRRSVSRTAIEFGDEQKSFEKLYGPLASRFDALVDDILRPVFHAPRHLGLLARFGYKSVLSADRFCRLYLQQEASRALFMGCAAHSSTSLSGIGSAALGLVLQLAAMSGGWPIAEGGAGRLTAALTSYYSSLGGELRLGHEVRSLKDLPPSRQVFFDLTPRQIARVAGQELSSRITSALTSFRLAPGVFKLDWALRGPIPWTHPSCALSPTVHLGGTADEIRDSEELTNRGGHPEKPFVLLVQPSLFDPLRAPQGFQTAWAYCHVPNASTFDMSQVIENQVERFAPGFRNLIVKRVSTSPAQLETYNPNYIGGDIAGGATKLSQLVFRPRVTFQPYSLGSGKYWICSSSTPPGPGVHGMCGYWAAHAALLSKDQ